MAFLERNLEQLTLVQKQVRRIQYSHPRFMSNECLFLAGRPEYRVEEGGWHCRAEAVGTK